MAIPLAVLLALLAVAAHVLARRTRGRTARVLSGVSACAREAGLVLGLFGFWQIAGRLARTRVDGAFERGQAIWDLERAVHLPSELALQGLILPHPTVVQAFNGYYLYGHLNVMVVTLIWLFARHRDHYPAIRTTLAVSSALCLLVQMLPVAPPRMFQRLGFVDTALLYGQSVYGAMGSGIANQLSAMPSLHIGWAVVVAAAVVRAGSSPWRWLVLAHPVAMMVVVAGTANHWHLDGVVAAAIVLATLAAYDRLSARRGAPTSRTLPAGASSVAALRSPV